MCRWLTAVILRGDHGNGMSKRRTMRQSQASKKENRDAPIVTRPSLTKNAILAFALLMVACMVSFTSVSAQEPTARDIVKKSDNLLRGDTNRGTYEMTITTPAWQRTLKLRSWQKGQEKTFIRLLEPPKDAGTGFLKIKNEMWTYLPSVERTIKIPPSMMMQPWMGSDFTNDDLVRESSIVDDYQHKLVKTESINGEDAWIVESHPRPDAPVVWGKIIHGVRKADYMPLKAEYFDEKGARIRVLVYSQIKRMHDRAIPTLWEMTPVTEAKKGRRTTIRIHDAEFNVPLEDIFNLKSLQRVK